MARLLFLVLGVLLAIAFSVQADDMIRVYTFSVKSCNGSPQLINIDIGRNECHDLTVGAHSLRAFKHEDDIKWLDDINNGTTKCDLVAFRSNGCLPDTIIGSLSLPEGIHQCFEYPFADPALSIQFLCRSTIVAATSTVTAAKDATSWYFGDDDKPTPTLVTVKSTATTTATQTIARRTAEQNTAPLQPRQVENNHRGLWMFHPWSLSLICYDCYTYKTDDFTQFDCRSGPNNPIDCGPRPLHGDDSTWTRLSMVTVFVASPTFTFTPVITSTVHTSSSSTPSPSSITVVIPISGAEVGDEDIAKRSWHNRVKFEHPYKSGVQVCADAEWEKRGQPDAEIRLQEIGLDMSNCDGNPDTVNLNVPEDEIVVSGTTITTPKIAVASSIITTTISIARREHAEQSQAAEVEAAPTHLDL